MTGEVHKRFHEQRRNWSVIPKIRSVIALLRCVLPCIQEAHRRCEPLPNKMHPAAIQTGFQAPVITAKPERVTLSDRSGSTEIDWDTGNGSMGFVFVTEEGGKPVLFANGSRGREIAP
jgi:hypothetical protein